MGKILTYDIPTRLFHWIFAGLFLGAFLIAKNIEDDSAIYPYHMLMGLTLVLVVLLRILWGLFGSRYARFSSFPLHPLALLKYFKSFLTGDKETSLGHNPASSWASLAMMLFGLGLGFTGYMMAQDNNKEFYEDIHELFANAFIIVVILHIAGVVLHTLRHKDGIGLSMIHGRKKDVAGSMAIGKSYVGVAIVFLAIVGSFVLYLGKNYNSDERNLNLFGTSLQLGEKENQ